MDSSFGKANIKADWSNKKKEEKKRGKKMEIKDKIMTTRSGSEGIKKKSHPPDRQTQKPGNGKETIRL